MTTQAAPPISSFPVPALEEAPGDIRERMLAVQEKAGFVPNVFLLLARRPEEFRAFLAYHDALMDKREGLTAAEREMIVAALARNNGEVSSAAREMQVSRTTMWRLMKKHGISA